MAYNEDKIDELIVLLRKASGENASPFRRKTPGEKASVRERSVHQLSQSFKALHGDTQALSHSFHGLTKVIGLSAFAGAIGDVITGLTKTVGTYQKLTDIGQSFGGSMFSMMQQAGEAGLTLDEFAKTLQRNSTAAAVMASHASDGAMSFLNLQKAIRDNLMDQGFYGMSLSELADTTGDYMETLRESGQLTRMSSQTQGIAVDKLIQETTMLAQVTGQSREEILKQTNAAMRSTTSAFAQHNMSQKAVNSLGQVTAAFAAMPGEAGKQFSQGINDVIGMQSAAFTDLGKALIGTGFGGVAGQLDQLATKIKAGTASQEDVFSFVNRFKTTVDASHKSLEGLAMTGDANAKLVMALDNSIQGLDKWRADLMKPQDAATQAMITLPSRIETITGSFRSKFYEGVIDSFITPLSKSAQLQENNIRFQLDQTNIDANKRFELIQQLNAIEKQRTDGFDKNLDNLQAELGTLFSNLGMLAAQILPPLVKTVTGLTNVVTTIANGLHKIGISEGWATLIAAGGVFLMLKRFLGALKYPRMLSDHVGNWASGIFGGRGRGLAKAEDGLVGGIGKIRGSSCLEPLYVYVCNEGFKGGGGGGMGVGPPVEGEEPEIKRPGLREVWKSDRYKGVANELVGRSGSAIKSLAQEYGSALLSGVGFLFTDSMLNWATDKLQSSNMIGGTTSSILEGVINPVASMAGAHLTNKVVTSVGHRLMSGIGKGAAKTLGDAGKATAEAAVTDIGGDMADAGATVAKKSITSLGGRLMSGLGESATGVATKLVGKGILKSLPFIGAVYSLNAAIGDARKGNYLGALLNVASGTADVTGVGAVAALGINAASIAQDVGWNSSSNSETPASPYNSRTAAGRAARWKDMNKPLTTLEYNQQWAKQHEIISRTPAPKSSDDKAKDEEHLKVQKQIAQNLDHVKNNTAVNAAAAKKLVNKSDKNGVSWWEAAIAAMT